jgi:hypothetical protein
MSDEFQKTKLNTVASDKGFTVEVKFAGGVLYRDADGEVLTDSGWLVNPHRIVLYMPRRDQMAQDRFQQILPNLKRALNFMGHPPEVG